MKIKKIRKLLDPIEGLIFRNADEFIKDIIDKQNIMDLTEVRFASHGVTFVYVCDSGQHIVDGAKWSVIEPWLEKMKMKEQIRHYCIDYITKKQQHSEKTSRMMDAVNELACGATDFEPITIPYYRFIEDTFQRVLGEDNHEWVEWYLYDNIFRDEGRYGGEVVIKGIEYDIATPEELVDICMDMSECNQAFFAEKE